MAKMYQKLYIFKSRDELIICNQTTFASSRNFDITTGCSFDTVLAVFKYDSKSKAVFATFMAAPLSTYDGLTRHGYPTSSQNSMADFKSVSSFHLNWNSSLIKVPFYWWPVSTYSYYVERVFHLEKCGDTNCFNDCVGRFFFATLAGEKKNECQKVFHF